MQNISLDTTTWSNRCVVLLDPTTHEKIASSIMETQHAHFFLWRESKTQLSIDLSACDVTHQHKAWYQRRVEDSNSQFKLVRDKAGVKFKLLRSQGITALIAYLNACLIKAYPDSTIKAITLHFKAAQFLDWRNEMEQVANVGKGGINE